MNRTVTLLCTLGALLLAAPLDARDKAAPLQPGKYEDWNGTIDRMEIVKTFSMADYQRVRVEPLDTKGTRLPPAGDKRHAFVVNVLNRATDLFVEGMIPLDTLPGDHYVYYENVRKVIGQRTRREFAIGDSVRVSLDRVDPLERKLQFSLVESSRSGQSNSGPSRGKVQPVVRKHEVALEGRQPRFEARPEKRKPRAPMQKVKGSGSGKGPGKGSAKGTGKGKGKRR